MAMAMPRRKMNPALIYYSCSSILLLLILLLATFVFTINVLVGDFDPVPFPDDYGYWKPSVHVPEMHPYVNDGIEYIGEGLLPEPEDIAWDPDAGVFYTGCSDGWIKRVTPNVVAAHTTVENWTYVSGRPLGVAFGLNKSLVVAEPTLGISIIKEKGKVEYLTNQEGGDEFNITDGVDVGADGTIYFTDACDVYGLGEDLKCALEGRPHGRFMSYDISTNKTILLATNLHFPNGVSVSPGQDSAIVCESMMRRCTRYYIGGEKKGVKEIFIENMPGFPDNIRYDGKGLYWIGISTRRTLLWDIAMKFPIVRKAMVILYNYIDLSFLYKNAGIMSVDLDGNPVAIYMDRAFDDATGGMKIGDYIYFISIVKPYIRRINLKNYAALEKFPSFGRGIRSVLVSQMLDVPL